MRVLCLHGAGANGQVSKAQSATFHKMLKMVTSTPVSFVHIEGQVESKPFPGLGDLFSPPFYHFYEPGNPASVLEGLSHIRSRVEEKGPFEGVFAFSEGAAAFLSTLVHGEMDFKFMVLVSPVLPFDISGQKRLDATMTNGPIFNIPAIVIRGRNDVIGLMAIMAKELLVEETTVSLEWPGGHEVPSACERSLWSSVVERILELCP